MVVSVTSPNRGALRGVLRSMQVSRVHLIQGGALLRYAALAASTYIRWGKAPDQGPSCNSEGAGSKEDGTHLLRGVLQPCDEPVTHPPWIGMFLSFVVFKLRSEFSNYPFKVAPSGTMPVSR